MFEKKCSVILVRDGSTLYTEQGRLYDVDDYPPLNEDGKAEIEKISDWLQKTAPNIDGIYTSSALRSIQSARILHKNLKKDFEIVDNLYERRPGIWGGLTFEQIEKQYADMLRQYHQNPCSFWPEGGETTVELKSRVGKIIDELVEKNQNKKIVLVTHAGVVQAAIAHALEISPRHQSKIYIPSGSATQINYYSEWSSLMYSGYIPVL